MNVSETTTIGEIAATFPASIRVFQRYGIDFCCGGTRPLGVVCRERHLAFAEVSAAIEASTPTQADACLDWSRASLGSLIDHILTTYHQPLSDELPRLEGMARKVAHVHGTTAPVLVRVAAVVTQLADELAAHMRKEETVLFPAIDALEADALLPIAALEKPIAVMEYEHDDAGVLLAELRTLTDDYRPPAWGCATLSALYRGLSELEAELHVHVHLENNVLFPRASRLAIGAATRRGLDVMRSRDDHGTMPGHHAGHRHEP